MWSGQKKYFLRKQRKPVSKGGQVPEGKGASGDKNDISKNPFSRGAESVKERACLVTKTTFPWGWGEYNLQGSDQFLDVFTFFFLSISPNDNIILILFSKVVIVFLLFFFCNSDSSAQNRFLIDKWNVLSIMDKTGLIDKKSKKSIFPPSLRTFLYKIWFRTTFMWTFFWCDVYFWQCWALNWMYFVVSGGLPYNVIT